MKQAPPRKPRRESPAIIDATITTAETVNRYNTRTRPDTELIARAIGSMYCAADTNATVVSAQPLRLFRPAGAGGKVWSGVRISARRKAFHAGQSDIRPHRKAMALASASDDVEEVLAHPALDLLARPDPRITGEDWSWLIAFWQEMTGRCYLHKGERAGGQPVSLYAMAPQFVNVVGSKTTYISHYRYGRDTTAAVDIPPADMIYVRGRVHPSDPLGAISWPMSVVLPGDMEAAALQSEIARWTNGGQPGGVIECDPATTDAQLAQIRAYIHGTYTGINKAGGWMVLRSSKVAQYAAKPHEMAYRDGLTTAQEYIYRAAGIPESMWKKNDANLASSLTGDRQYMGYTIWPRLCSLASALTEWLLPEFAGTEGWYFGYDDPRKEDRAALILEVKTLTDCGGMNLNEGRARLGMDPGPPELDEYRYNGQPLMTKAEVQQRQQAQADALAESGMGEEEDEPPAEKAAVLASLAGKVKSGELTVAAGKAIALASYPELTGSVDEVFSPPPVEPIAGGPDPAAKGLEPGSGSGGERGAVGGDGGAAGASGDGGGGESVPSAASGHGRDGDGKSGHHHELKIKNMDLAVDSLAARLRAWYGNVAPSMVGAEGVTGPNEAQIGELERIIRDGLRQIYQSGAVSGIAELGMAMPPVGVPTKAVEYAQAHAAELVTQVTDTLRERVREIVTQSVTEGTSITDVQGLLRSEGFTASRAENIARTESSMAYNEGMRETWEEVGVSKKKWVLAGGPCPVCQAVAEQYNSFVDIGRPFYWVGDVIQGTDGKDFKVTGRDILAPPVHPQCRCTLEAGPLEDTP